MFPRPNTNAAAALALLSAAACPAQEVVRDIPYAEPSTARQVLDVHTPAAAAKAPVVFWIHGGGWQHGDKADVQAKPKFFTDRGFVFVSTNYRLLPDVAMEVIVRDVAQAAGWVHRHIAAHGGDPERILVMGHSAGAQLAALVCTDDRHLKAEGVPLTAIKGCVPVDGDTFDLPAIIATAELRATPHGQPLPVRGHRQKFGDDPRKFVDFSAVTHVARGKGIPPFLVLHVAGQPDTTAQAQRLGAVLRAADVPATVFAAPETTHRRINDALGQPDDPATAALTAFLAKVLE
ncbi:MAG: alpha/beta hydrolase [Planctomycetia bacterium]